MQIDVRVFLFVTLPFSVLGARKRAISTGSTFQLYAYGQGCGGLPLYYANGLAYVGNSTLSDSSDAAVVIFTRDSEHHFLGNPNTTLSTPSPAWSNATLFVPTLDSRDKRVGFLSPNNSTGNSTITVSGFAFYGSTAMLIGNNGAIATAFYGKELETGEYDLFWNDTTEGNVPLTLRSVAPSNPGNKEQW